MAALSIDTAANVCAVAVTNIKTGETLSSQSLDLKRGHAEILMPMIDQCMKQAGLDFSKIDRVISSTGPGSFTGVRVGLSTARAIALGITKPVIGVSNLQACALYADKISDTKMPVLVLLDARRNQVYTQMFERGVPKNKASICQISEFDMGVYGDVLCCGSGAALVFEQDENQPSGIKKIIHSQDTAPIDIFAKAGIAAPIPQNRPEPIYLRSADAKKQQGFAVNRISTEGSFSPQVTK